MKLYAYNNSHHDFYNKWLTVIKDQRSRGSDDPITYDNDLLNGVYRLSTFSTFRTVSNDWQYIIWENRAANGKNLIKINTGALFMNDNCVSKSPTLILLILLNGLDLNWSLEQPIFCLREVEAYWVSVCRFSASSRYFEMFMPGQLINEQNRT